MKSNQALSAAGRLAVLLAATSVASAQASFAEGFDGKTVADLQSEGWSFRNQSLNPGPLGWRPANVTDPYDGTHYMVTDGYCMAGSSGNVGSNWALFPDVPNQIAGDELVLHLAEGWSALRSDVLQVRYSPSGGTSTGSGHNAVGDFDVLLAEFVHDTIGWWQPHTITLPGAGRIALRYHVPTGHAASMYVDAVSVGDPPGGAIPLPGVGETVHWDSAISPVVFGPGTTNIVAGGTVVVDPGVVVRLDPGAFLNVDGSLEFREGTTLDAAPGAYVKSSGGELAFLGTSASPVTIHGDQGYWTAGLRAWTRARLTMIHVNADVFGWVASGSVAVVDQCTFTKSSASAFEAPGFRTYNGTLAVRNSSFDQAGIIEEGGYILLDGSTFTDSKIELHRVNGPQPLYLNDLVLTGKLDDAPIVVHRFDVDLGPNNLIQGNAFPVRLATGGLASGSFVPLSGNANDFITGEARIGGRVTWPDVGLPYVLEWDTDIPAGSGRLTIEPGVTARFKRGQNTVSDSFAIEFFADLVCRGTPDRPIVLTDDGAGWGGLFFGDNSAKRPKLEHTIVSGADTGAIATLCNVRIESCLFVNNDRGARSSSNGAILARSTRFENNAVGVETSPGSGTVGINAGQANLNGLANPNSFIGNGAGVSILNPNITQVDARGNYWGDPTGPMHPSNPGGQGDSAGPTATVQPFLGAAPDATDHAPIVRLQNLANILEEDTKVILHWDVEDDGSLVSQRLEYTPHGSNPPLSVLVANIDPATRSLEVVVPQSPPSSNTLNPVFRLVAVDDTGKEGWDEETFFTPYQDFQLEFTVDDMPAVVRPGEQYDVCWSQAYADAYLSIDDIDWAFSLGGTTTTCLSLGVTVPGVSTDRARIVVVHPVGAGGRVRYEYSDYFSIRPDPVIGDEPPFVQVLSPAGGTFPGGALVPIVWNATDDEGLRSFAIQASYDGGRAWSFVVDDLPGDVFHYAWQLPASTGIDDVRLRVIARDLRYQASSSSVQLSIASGDGPAQSPDTTGPRQSTNPRTARVIGR